MEIDLFHPPCSDDTAHTSLYETYHNNEIASVDDANQFIFNIPPSTHWRNFAGSYFKIHLRLVKADDAVLADGDKVSTVNQIALSLFKNFTIYINDAKVTSHEDHPYTSYIENQWSYSKEVSETWPVLAGWEGDKHGHFDDMDDTNPGFKARRNRLNKDRVTVVECQPKIFPFCTNQIFPPDLKWRIEADRTSDRFLLLADPAAPPAKLKIEKISLVLENVVLKKTVESQLFAKIGRIGAQYDYPMVKFQSYFIPSGRSNYELPHHNLLFPHMPSTLLMALVEQDVFLGELNKNPFRFQAHGVTEYCIKVNGQFLFTSGALKVDFDTGDYGTLYKSVLSMLGYWGSDKAPAVTYNAFDNGNVMFPADIAKKFPETINSENSAQELSIKFTFKAPTPKNLKLLIYPTYKNAAMVHGSESNREVSMMYY